jgi:hypothetical protein
VIDAHYGTNYATDPDASAGKIMAWTAWTHQPGIEAPINQIPVVNAGPDYTILFGDTLTLKGTASDDNLLSIWWCRQSGPGFVTFEDSHAFETTVTFTTPGDYVLRFGAGDGELYATNELNVTVEELPSETLPSLEEASPRKLKKAHPHKESK